MRPLFGLPLGANLSMSRLAPSAADTGPGINMAVTAPSTHPEVGPVKFKPPSTTRMVVGAIGDAVAQWSGGKAIFTPALAAARERHEQAQAAMMQKAGEFAEWKNRYDYERANPKPANVAPNDTERDYELIRTRHGQAAADQFLLNLGDPIVTTTLPGNRVFSGPRSKLGQSLQSGTGAAPAAPSLTPGAVVNGQRFKGGDFRNPASWEPAGGAGSQGPRTFP